MIIPLLKNCFNDLIISFNKPVIWKRLFHLISFFLFFIFIPANPMASNNYNVEIAIVRKSWRK